jgi:hypothetical protein
MQAVHYVVGADRVINNSEKEMLKDLSVCLEVEISSDEPKKPQSPPAMESDVKEYVVRMILLAGWIDGDYVDSEKIAARECFEMLGVNGNLMETIHLDVRKSIFISSIIGTLENIVHTSPIGENIIKKLQLSDEDIRDVSIKWRENQ